MADYIMCSSINCPVRDTCYRSGVQMSWNNFEYACNENSGFSDYLPVSIKVEDNYKNIGLHEAENLRNHLSQIIDEGLYFGIIDFYRDNNSGRFNIALSNIKKVIERLELISHIC